MKIRPALRSLLRIDAKKRTIDYYQALSEMFELLTHGSAMYNLGLWAGGEREPHEAQRALVDKVIEGLPTRGHWLDVGCGPGGPAWYLAVKYPELSITGVDLDVGKVQRALALSTEAPGRLHFLVGDADCLPFTAEKFDALISIEAAYHFRDRQQFTHQAYRVLKPGAPIALTDIVWRGNLRSPADLVRRAAAQKALGAAELPNPEVWRAHLERYGFEQLELIDISDAVFAGFHHWAENLRRMSTALTAPDSVIAAAAAGLDRIYAERASSPLGYVLVRARKAAG